VPHRKKKLNRFCFLKLKIFVIVLVWFLVLSSSTESVRNFMGQDMAKVL